MSKQVDKAALRGEVTLILDSLGPITPRAIRRVIFNDPYTLGGKPTLEGVQRELGELKRKGIAMERGGSWDFRRVQPWKNRGGET